MATRDETRMVRYPNDLADKLRVISFATGETVSDILVRLTKGAVEAEFSVLPPAMRKRAAGGFKRTGAASG